MPSDSTALATLSGDIDYRTLAQLTGQDGSFNTSSAFPRLRINTDFVTEDEDGTEYTLTPGTFAVKDPDGREIYAKTIQFRPLVNRLQYRRYDPKGGPDGKGATVGKTILVSNLGYGGEEPIDDIGGVACGKLRGKEGKGPFSGAQQAVQDQTKAYRYVWGQVWMTGATKEGEEVTLNGYPCLLRVRGTNYMPIGEVFDALDARKRHMSSVKLNLSTKREKNGDTTFYVIKYEYDPKEQIPLSASDIELLKEVLEEVNDTNKSIIEKHKAARTKAVRGNAGSDLSDDFFERDE